MLAMKFVSGGIEKGSERVVDTGVSVDGTWKKRGFTSFNGCVAAISIDTGTILDLEVMSRFYQGCINTKTYKKVDHASFNKLKDDHDCSINHVTGQPQKWKSRV